MSSIQATGVGSLPGTDMPGALRHVLGSMELAWLPELPARGVGADMVGRTAAMLEGLAVDLQPQGWRLGERSGIDHHRARSLLRADLDELEEYAQTHHGQVTITATGPLTLAALMERPRGDKVLADHGARRELASSLGLGLASLVGEMRRRLPEVSWRVQLDEPSMPAVMSGQVPTASGFSRLRPVDRPLASALLEKTTAPLAGIDCPVRLHSCAAGLDLDLVLRRVAGIDQVGLDARWITGQDWDVLGPWLEEGGQLVLGLARTDQADQLQRPDELVRRGLELLRPLGLDPTVLHAGLVLSTACGLAGWSTRAASAQLDALVEAAPLLAEQLAR